MSVTMWRVALIERSADRENPHWHYVRDEEFPDDAALEFISETDAEGDYYVFYGDPVTVIVESDSWEIGNPNAPRYEYIVGADRLPRYDVECIRGPESPW